MAERLNVAIVGCGFVANYHVRAWMNIGARVVVAVDVVEERAREFAKRYGIPQYTTRVNDLKKLGVDAASVCTPPHTHREIIGELLDNGINVLSEKPLTTKYVEALELYNIAKKTGRRFWVVMNYLYTPYMIKARELVEVKKVLGALRRVDILVYAPQEVILKEDGGWLMKLPGGVFGEVLPHPLYIAQSLLGNLDVVAVDKLRLSGSRWQKYDDLHIVLRGERGLGRIVITYNAARFDIYAIVEGSEKTMIVNPIGKVLALLDQSWKWLRNALSFKPYIGVGVEMALKLKPRDPYMSIAKTFAEHILSNKPLSPGMEQILNQVKVYEEILRKLEHE